MVRQFNSQNGMVRQLNSLYMVRQFNSKNVTVLQARDSLPRLHNFGLRLQTNAELYSGMWCRVSLVKTVISGNVSRPSSGEKK
jgi:hypothetical protein